MPALLVWLLFELKQIQANQTPYSSNKQALAGLQTPRHKPPNKQEQNL